MGCGFSALPRRASYPKKCYPDRRSQLFSAHELAAASLADRVQWIRDGPGFGVAAAPVWRAGQLDAGSRHWMGADRLWPYRCPMATTESQRRPAHGNWHRLVFAELQLPGAGNRWSGAGEHGVRPSRPSHASAVHISVGPRFFAVNTYGDRQWL